MEGGRAPLSLQVSTSQLIEIGDALDYVLGYPYGCGGADHLQHDAVAGARRIP